MDTMETKELEGYKGYTVRADGKVLTSKGKVLASRVLKNGYESVLIVQNNGKQKEVYVHRLVLSAFDPLPISESLLVVDHINNCKTDNRLCNLQWLTHGDNIRKYWDDRRAKS